MSFYLQLLEEKYSYLETAHEQSLNDSVAVEDKPLCACGMEYAEYCQSKKADVLCEEGKEALELQ